MTAERKPYYIVEHASGYTPGSIGYTDHPTLRVGANVEAILNKHASEGYVLDRLERLSSSASERLLVVMRLATLLDTKPHKHKTTPEDFQARVEEMRRDSDEFEHKLRAEVKRHEPTLRALAEDD